MFYRPCSFQNKISLGLWLSLFEMKSILHLFRNVSSLECKRPIVCDTNLEGVKVEKLQSNFLERADEINVCMEVLTSGLIEAVAFPPALLSPELL